MPDFAVWPPWAGHLFWSVTIIGGSYVIGHVVRAVAAARLASLAARTKSDWDDVFITEIARRFPFWGVLVGISISLSQWPLSAETHQRASLVVSAVGITSVTFAAAAGAARLVGRFGPRTAPAAPVSGLTQNITRIIVILLGLLVMVRSFGYDITPYLTALGVSGLAIALALQDPLSNLFAGLSMTLSGHVHIGDYVKLDSGVEGSVSDFDWRATTIRMLSGSVVIVPNSKLAQAIVTNYDRPSRDLAVAIDLTVEKASDLVALEKIALETATDVIREVPGAVKDFEPFVRFLKLTPGEVTFSVVLRGERFADQYLIRHEFLRRLQPRYVKAGILPAPTPPAPPSPPPPSAHV